MERENIFDGEPKETKYGRDIFFVGKQVHTIFNALFSEIGLGDSQGIQLMLIHKHPGIEMKEVSTLLAVDKTTITKSIKKLIQKEFVKKVINKDDKRRFSLFLTKKGQEKIPLIRNIIVQVNNELVSSFSQKEKSDLLILLEKVSSNLLKINNGK